MYHGNVARFGGRGPADLPAWVCEPAATVSYMPAIVTGPSADVLAWWRDGERTLHTAVEALPDADLAGPSLLAGWSRQTLLAHLAGNADALVNLLTWARTGVETPMYASAGARDEETAARPAPEVRGQFAGSQARLAAAIEELPDAAWQAQVRTAQGALVPATEVPWMRVRETWVHAVDLAAPVTFADIPAGLAAVLIDSITDGWRGRAEVSGITFAATDSGRRWGEGSRVVSAAQADLLGWMSGRGSADAIDFDGPPFAAPPWL